MCRHAGGKGGDKQFTAVIDRGTYGSKTETIQDGYSFAAFGLDNDLTIKVYDGDTLIGENTSYNVRGAY